MGERRTAGASSRRPASARRRAAATRRRPSFLTAEIAASQPRSGYDFGFVLRPGPDEAATDDGAADGASATASAEAPRASARRGRPPTPKCGRSSSSSRRPTRARRRGAGRAPRRGQRVPADPGGFAYWASPSNPGVTGNRRFCVDETASSAQYDLDAAVDAAVRRSAAVPGHRPAAPVEPAMTFPPAGPPPSAAGLQPALRRHPARHPERAGRAAVSRARRGADGGRDGGSPIRPTDRGRDSSRRRWRARASSARSTR